MGKEASTTPASAGSDGEGPYSSAQDLAHKDKPIDGIRAKMLYPADVNATMAQAADIRNRADTQYQPSGTCKKGPASAPMAVVDAQLRVRGIDGLRVADASIMPTLIGGNTNAPTITVGEKSAQLLRDGGQPPGLAGAKRRASGFPIPRSQPRRIDVPVAQRPLSSGPTRRERCAHATAIHGPKIDTGHGATQEVHPQRPRLDSKLGIRRPQL